ncbi:MAG TPA: 6-carboxytetrahydropterin synthase QueD [Chloroflexota bacterium]
MASYTLKKRFTFEAAHFLPHHEGKCRRLHGHSWVGWVEVTGNGLHPDGPQAGMVMDFGCISAVVKPMVDDYLDHHCLNDTLPLASPTSEAVAAWICSHLTEKGLPVSAVTVEETCTNVCSYRV